MPRPAKGSAEAKARMAAARAARKKKPVSDLGPETDAHGTPWSEKQFSISVKNGASPPKTVVTATERAARETRIAEMESALRAAANPQFKSQGRVDTAALKANLAKEKAALEKLAPRELKGKSKDTLWRQAQELEAKVKEGLSSERDFRKREGDPGFGDEVMKQVRQAQDSRWQESIRTLKNIKREIEPDNPNAGNVEKLRRSGFEATAGR